MTEKYCGGNHGHHGTFALISVQSVNLEVRIGKTVVHGLLRKDGGMQKGTFFITGKKQICKKHSHGIASWRRIGPELVMYSALLSQNKMREGERTCSCM